MLLRQTKTDIAVWVTTFALTVFADLTVAVEVGMILAALLYIRRVAATTTVDQVTAQYLEEGRVHILQDKHIPDYVTILRIHGPFLFGTTDKLQGVIDRIDELTPIVVVRLRNMTAIDATGLRALEDLTRAAARVRPDRDLLWRAGAAAGGDGAGRVQSRWPAPRTSARTSTPRWRGPERSTIGCPGPVEAPRFTPAAGQ